KTEFFVQLYEKRREKSHKPRSYNEAATSSGAGAGSLFGEHEQSSILDNNSTWPALKDDDLEQLEDEYFWATVAQHPELPAIFGRGSNGKRWRRRPEEKTERKIKEETTTSSSDGTENKGEQDHDALGGEGDHDDEKDSKKTKCSTTTTTKKNSSVLDEETQMKPVGSSSAATNKDAAHTSRCLDSSHLGNKCHDSEQTAGMTRRRSEQEVRSTNFVYRADGTVGVDLPIGPTIRFGPTVRGFRSPLRLAEAIRSADTLDDYRRSSSIRKGKGDKKNDVEFWEEHASAFIGSTSTTNEVKEAASTSPFEEESTGDQVEQESEVEEEELKDHRHAQAGPHLVTEKNEKNLTPDVEQQREGGVAASEQDADTADGRVAKVMTPKAARVVLNASSSDRKAPSVSASSAGSREGEDNELDASHQTKSSSLVESRTSPATSARETTQHATFLDIEAPASSPETTAAPKKGASREFATTQDASVADQTDSGKSYRKRNTRPKLGAFPTDV
ncbi:unnamed protein product, partial [Amoebophrya sp. A25]